jgi:hypothetical protein
MISYFVLLLCFGLIFTETRIWSAAGLVLLASAYSFPAQTLFSVLFVGGLSGLTSLNTVN